MEAPTVNVNFFDPAVNQCPMHAYALLQDVAPVWRDPATGWFVVTRFDDVRAIILDKERFSNSVGDSGFIERRVATWPGDPETSAKIAARVERWRRRFVEDGWTPAPTVGGRDDPEHIQLRRVLGEALSPAKIKALEPFIETFLTHQIDSFIDAGRCKVVAQYARPLPLNVMGRLVGLPAEDLPQIEVWARAFAERLGMMQTDEESFRSVEAEIEAQHYVHRRIEQLRATPDGTFLSELVNREIPGWGRTLNDNELIAEVIIDLFVGGSRTTAGALSSGVRLLCENPQVWEWLKADPDTHVEPFVEEVLRLESPAKSLLRFPVVDTELHGVKIPAGSTIHLLYGAANRDARRFERPAQIDLERDKVRQHLAFGQGLHRCLGADLARCELYHAFKTLTERIDRMWLIGGREGGSHEPNFFLRIPNEFEIGFTACTRQGDSR